MPVDPVPVPVGVRGRGGGGLMPLAGSLDIRPLIEGSPEVVLDEDVTLRVDDVDILQVLYEVRVADRESLVPPALNPTIPPVICFLVYRAKESDVRPLRPGPAAADRPVGRTAPGLSGLGPLRQPCAVRVAGPLVGLPGRRPVRSALRRFHDRVDCTVSELATGGGRSDRSWTCRSSTRCR